MEQISSAGLKMEASWARRRCQCTGVRVKLPALTDKDKEDIRFGVMQALILWRLRFVRNADAIREIREILDEKVLPCRLLRKSRMKKN